MKTHQVVMVDQNRREWVEDEVKNEGSTLRDSNWLSTAKQGEKKGTSEYGQMIDEQGT